jgi:hypothetical protein
MRTLKPGTIVQMKVSTAKWMLDHPEIYTFANNWKASYVKEFDREAIIHMLCCLGEPVYGVVLDQNEQAYKVLWAIGHKKSETTWYWVERKHFDIVRAK